MRGVNIIHDRENDRVGFTTPSEECFSKHPENDIPLIYSPGTLWYY